mgnify:CR=1 FL=1
MKSLKNFNEFALNNDQVSNVEGGTCWGGGSWGSWGGSSWGCNTTYTCNYNPCDTTPETPDGGDGSAPPPIGGGDTSGGTSGGSCFSNFTSWWGC